MTRQKKQPNHQKSQTEIIPQPIQIISSKKSLFDDREYSVEDHLRNKCKQYDILCIKLLPSISGIPDRILIGKGKIIFVELKAPGKKPRSDQRVWIKKLRDHGAIVYVIDNIPDVDKFISKEFLGD